MLTHFQIDGDDPVGALSQRMFQALIGYVVDIEFRAPADYTGYPCEHVYVVRVDDDGDVVVCEMNDDGTPAEHSTVAIPQNIIYRTFISVGNRS